MQQNIHWCNSQLSPQNREQLKYLIHKYIENYFLRRYSPEQIPNCYAMILNNLSICTNLLSVGQPSTMHDKMKRESLSYLKRAHKYLVMYELQIKNNQQNDLSKFVDKKTIRFESALHGKILCQLTRIYLDCFEWSKGMEHITKCCEYFINNHKLYTCCSGYESIDFVMDFIKHLLLWFDYNQEISYQIKWKYLLKKARKTLTYFDRNICFDRYARCYIYLGIYYFLWYPHKIRKAKKYLILGIKIIQRYDPYHPTLTFAYQYMVSLHQSLGEHNKCKKWLRASIDLDQHTKFDQNTNGDIEQLKDIENGITIKGPVPIREFVFNAKKNISLENGLERWQLAKWRHYFKNNRSYQIMKNICDAKECNLYQCKRKDVKMKKCSKCQSVFYCCKNHQKLDWILQHKNECNQSDKRNMKYTLQKDWKLVIAEDMPDCMIMFE